MDIDMPIMNGIEAT